MLGKWISTTARFSRIYFSRCFEPFGLSGGQHIFLLCIAEHPGLTQDQLAEQLSMNKSTVARAVPQLEHNGWIHRESAPQDKRVWKLFATAKTEALIPNIKQILKKWDCALTNGLTEEENRHVEGILIHLARNAMNAARE